MSDTAPSEPTRPTAPTEKAADAIPIPEADARSRKARTVKIQDILSAHARALDVRLEEGMRDIRLAMDAAIRRSGIHEAPPQPQPMPPYPGAYAPQAPVAPTPAPMQHDIAKGLAAQTDERFQALSMRLEKIEEALRGVTLGGARGAEIDGKLDALADGIARFGDSEEQLFERFLEAQREGLETQRAGLEDLTRRVGAGVAAVIRAMQNELTQTVRRLELTSDTSGNNATDEAIRLERTMMAIAEHQEAVLDERLNAIRQSIGVPDVSPTTNGSAETVPTNGSAEKSQESFD